MTIFFCILAVLIIICVKWLIIGWIDPLNLK